MIWMKYHLRQSNYSFSVILLERLLERIDFSCFLMQSNHKPKNKKCRKTAILNGLPTSYQ